MPEFVPFGSPAYFGFFLLIFVARGADFLSTWIATPSLSLEANPLARRLGWRWGLILNLGICFAFAFWPLPNVVIVTASVLVAARNFQSAWLMRSLGESNYRLWMAERLSETPMSLFLFCLLAQAFLLSALGIGLMVFSQMVLVPFAVGMGIFTYALAVTIYTLIAVRRSRRFLR